MKNLLLVLVALAGIAAFPFSPGVQAQEKAKSKCECGCSITGVCECVPCPAAIQISKLVAEPADTTYAAFRQSIDDGKTGFLTVGSRNLTAADFTPNCRVDSGTLGADFPDGVYWCERINGKATMRPVPIPKAMAPTQTLPQPVSPFALGNGINLNFGQAQTCSGPGCQAPPRRFLLGRFR